MIERSYDAVVVGGGAAGTAAAVALADAGSSVAIVDREPLLGGILMQCIHNGFGLTEFREELTGPEYAEIYAEMVGAREIEQYLDTTVLRIEPGAAPEVPMGSPAGGFSGSAGTLEGGPDGSGGLPEHRVVAINPREGALSFRCAVVILATGSRERARGAVRIPGTRPAGVYTAGLAQRLLNMDGFVPGERAVVIGSGDIGLIMARRMSWIGASVPAVIEIQEYPSGLTRNISQCLHDFDIPLYLSHIVVQIHGRDRVTGVDVAPVDGGIPRPERAFHISCDTVLLSVGLIPETELAANAGVELDRQTGGARVDSRLMTRIPGIFSAGNVLHVHDLVDYVTEEARRAGEGAAAYLGGERPGPQLPTVAGTNVRYVSPSSFDINRPTRLYLRPLIVDNKVPVTVTIDGRQVYRKVERHVQPSEMIQIDGKRIDVSGLDPGPDSTVEVSVG